MCSACSNRSYLLAATIGGSFALHMLIGLALGLSFTYVLMAVLYTAIGLVTLQFFFAYVNENTVSALLQLAK
ncbi:unnamed protein product [Gongylonema pulchrum]|uniref:Transmembrane protein n=1 Tax=Gongylonema pulchrum TaxID=637853 RepID=A0A183D922_9BILA|nr:unnamed protein product [Gongylonema pulchrum]